MIKFDLEKCISCGECEKVCPCYAINMADGKPVVNNDACFDCGHCECTCPADAVKIETELFTIEAKTELEKSIIERRSIRHFKAETPDKSVIEHALKLCQWAPSSKNQRTLGWSVILGREAVRKALEVAFDWSRENNRNTALINLFEQGKNPITCDAPCLIFAYIPENAVNPEVDCGLTMGILEQLLNENGLGTCWGGFAARLFACDQSLKDYIGVPEGMKICSTLMVGVADEKYNGIPERPLPIVFWKE